MSAVNAEVAPMNVVEEAKPAAAAAPKRSLQSLQRLFVKNGGHRLSAADLERINAEINAQTAKIRAGKEMKLRENNPREWWLVVRKLLLLKYDAALFTGNVASVSMTNPGDLFSEIKLRWWVKGVDGTPKRLQRLVQCRNTLTAAEILSIVTEFTAARYPQLGGPLTIAVRADLLDICLRYPKNSPDARTVCPDPEAMRTLCLDDVVTVPLEFPGPCLPNSTVIDLDVTFAVPPSNITTPACYAAEEKKAILPELVDAGMNVCDKELNEHPLAVLHEAKTVGVSQAIAMSFDVESSRYNVTVARSARGNAFATVGVHPCYISTGANPEEAVKELGELIEEDRKREDGQRLIVAVGEIGLDFEKDGGVPHDVQLRWLDLQLQLACRYDMPVILHLRGPDSFNQAVNILRSRSSPWRGTINCFNGSLEDMRQVVEMGFYITWTGLLCNDSRAEVLRNVVANGVPDRYLIGSDAPHLIPFNMEKPYPKCNRPCTLPHVAAMLANILKMPVHQVAALTTANARAVFKLPQVAFNSSLPAAGIPYDANAFIDTPLIGMKKPVEQPKKGKKGLRILSDTEIAALIPAGQKPFVDKGFVYACQPGVCNALEALATTNKDALKQSITEFMQSHVITLVHDPNVRKHKKRRIRAPREAAPHGRRVRRRVAPHRRIVRPARGRGGHRGRGGRRGH